MSVSQSLLPIADGKAAIAGGSLLKRRRRDAVSSTGVKLSVSSTDAVSSSVGEIPSVPSGVPASTSVPEPRELAAAAAAMRAEVAVRRGVQDLKKVEKMRLRSEYYQAVSNQDLEAALGTDRGMAASKGKLDLCSSSQHVCGPQDFKRGCGSCGYTCHDDCRDTRCKYDPCGYCLRVDIPTFAGSQMCNDLQKRQIGCHACRRSACFMASPSCPAKCTRGKHVCIEVPGKGCCNCGKICHADNNDARCEFYLQVRGDLGWSATPEQLLDSQAGTGGALPHMTQVNWNFINGSNIDLLVDGVTYRRGYGFPGDPERGEANNCLIDSLRQCLGYRVCDIRKVREDLLRDFENIDGGDARRRVTRTSLLDVGCHWQAILVSLSRHNDAGVAPTCDFSGYCVVALSGDRPGHGVMFGNRNPIKRLVILNWGDVHFDPCLRLLNGR